MTRRSFIQLTRAKKTLLALMFDMYLTSASQSQLDNLYNRALMTSHTLRSSHISSLAADWPSSLRWFVSKRDQILHAVPIFFKVKGALNESSMLKTAVCPQEYFSVIAYILVCIGITEA